MRIFNLILIIFCLYSLQVKGQGSDTEQIHVIGNRIGFNQSSLKGIKEIFKGKETYWKNKEQVIIVLPSARSENATIVAKEIFAMSVTAMQKYWLQMVFQGRGNPPVFLSTDKEIIDYVAKNPGAIGLIYRKEKEVPASLLIKIKS